MSEVLRHAQASGWWAAEEGDGPFRGVTPETRRYPRPAAGFRRRALFFEKPTIANQSAFVFSGRLVSPLEQNSSGFYISETMEAYGQSNRAYGIS